MDRVYFVFFGDGDDLIDVQIPFDRLTPIERADLVRLVRFKAMQGEAVFVCVDGARAQTEFGGGAEDADGDFGSIGNEKFAHGEWGLWTWGSVFQARMGDVDQAFVQAVREAAGREEVRRAVADIYAEVEREVNQRRPVCI